MEDNTTQFGAFDQKGEFLFSFRHWGFSKGDYLFRDFTKYKVKRVLQFADDPNYTQLIVKEIKTK